MNGVTNISMPQLNWTNCDALFVGGNTFPVWP